MRIKNREIIGALFIVSSMKIRKNNMKHPIETDFTTEANSSKRERTNQY
jgi:hypothetical protein